MSETNLVRCPWSASDPFNLSYHDNEWGVPLHDDRKLFEMLCLEGAQAGLSWLTVLKKRQAFKQAFDDFDINKIANYNSKKLTSLLNNDEIIKNHLKINSVIINAQSLLKLKVDFGSFDNYLWQFVDFKPVKHHYKLVSEVPPTNKLATQLSNDFKRRGFKFVGPIICYSFIQAIGMVNDHLISCYRYNQL